MKHNKQVLGKLHDTLASLCLRRSKDIAKTSSLHHHPYDPGSHIYYLYLSVDFAIDGWNGASWGIGGGIHPGGSDIFVQLPGP
eukprot:760343-Hanusia_phi.AAC.2